MNLEDGTNKLSRKSVRNYQRTLHEERRSYLLRGGNRNHASHVTFVLVGFIWNWKRSNRGGELKYKVNWRLYMHAVQSYRGIEDYLLSSLTLAPDGVSGQLYAQATSLLRKELLVALNKS